MRINQQYSSTKWPEAWKNLHTVPFNDEIRSTWYRTIHDLIPSQTRLFRSHRQPYSAFTHCMTPDTLIHRLTACKETTGIWRWIRSRLAAIVRTDSRYIPAMWLLFPNMAFWLRPKHKALLWILRYMIHYIISTRSQ